VLDDHFVDAGGALRSLRDLSAELADAPIAQFHGLGRLNNDPTNWWSPTITCLERMLEATNFTVLGKTTRGNRATLHCRANDDPEVMRWRMLDRGVLP
jgi:hypothetical protein